MSDSEGCYLSMYSFLQFDLECLCVDIRFREGFRSNPEQVDIRETSYTHSHFALAEAAKAPSDPESRRRKSQSNRDPDSESIYIAFVDKGTSARGNARKRSCMIRKLP